MPARPEPRLATLLCAYILALLSLSAENSQPKTLSHRCFAATCMDKKGLNVTKDLTMALELMSIPASLFGEPGREAHVTRPVFVGPGH